MMTAVITGSGPLATPLCNSAERSIVNGLRETALRCRDSGLHARMYVLDELADQREALLTPVQAWKACSGTMPKMRIYSGNLTLGDAGQPGSEQAITVRHTTFMRI